MVCPLLSCPVIVRTGIQGQPIIFLKEGTETLQGRSQVMSNINACQSVSEAIRTTLGPRGMDKLIVDSKGAVTISNDGATILKKLDIVHPAAKTLVDIAKSQDDEVLCSYEYHIHYYSTDRWATAPQVSPFWRLSS